MWLEKNFERYERQIVLKGFGREAQNKLLEASVLVIGAGGLGCPALQYLAAAGVGRIGIVDNDKVSLNNLHRQTLYTSADIGKLKVAVSALRLRMVNPEIEINTYPLEMECANALDIIRGYDIVLDGTDNFSSRYMINDACALLNKPLVFGAVSQYEGQVAVFNVADKDGFFSNYRDLFPDLPDDDKIPNCAQAGVIGVLPGIIGTMQAAEVIKLITGIGTPLAGKLLTYNLLDQQLYEIAFGPSEQGKGSLPVNEAAFLNMNYKHNCVVKDKPVIEIDAQQFNDLRIKPSTLVIDVREEIELPHIDGFEHKKIPMSVFKSGIEDVNADHVILICQHGIRSLYAAELLQQENNSIKVLYSLKGGISRWASELGLG